MSGNELAYTLAKAGSEQNAISVHMKVVKSAIARRHRCDWYQEAIAGVSDEMPGLPEIVCGRSWRLES